MTSRKPWSVCIDGNGAAIRDALGNRIGSFLRWEDAEVVIDALATMSEKDKLEDQIHDLQEEIKALQATRR